MARVWAALSGGVDSSVAAALLVAEGHDVTGVTLLLESGVPGESALDAARAVCGILGIEHRTLDATEAFAASVVGPYCAAYAGGLTPNPCVACNEAVKFGVLLDAALDSSAEGLATGHYAAVIRDAAGRARLSRAADPQRDQSYFLYRVGPERLGRLAFPLAGMRKVEVRERAAAMRLPSAERPESREACFVPEAGRRALLAAHVPECLEPGDVLDAEGRVLGRHEGVGMCTLGQRKGLGIATGAPAYVVGIDAPAREVTLGDRQTLASEVIADDAVWWEGPEARVTAMVRYRTRPVPALARFAGGRLTVSFDEPVAGVAPGQAVVCYAGGLVAGGGTVSAAR